MRMVDMLRAMDAYIGNDSGNDGDVEVRRETMDENEARALARRVEKRSPHWHVEDVFQTATPGAWAVIVAHPAQEGEG